jgi:2-dehydropantoate 2-reductase
MMQRSLGTRKIVVLGGGAMGSFYASKLALSAQKYGRTEVWMVSDWADHVAAIQSEGMRLQTHSETEDNGKILRVSSLHATSDLSDVIADGILPEIIIVAVKGHSTAAAARKARLLLADSTHSVVVTLQNGMGHVEILEQILVSSKGAANGDFTQCQDGLPNVSIFAGVTNNGAMVTSPGLVVHTGIGPTFVAPTSTFANDQAQDLVQLFRLCGMDAEALICSNPAKTEEYSSLSSMQWKKLMINAVINPVQAYMLTGHNQPTVTNVLHVCLRPRYCCAVQTEVCCQQQHGPYMLLSITPHQLQL